MNMFVCTDIFIGELESVVNMLKWWKWMFFIQFDVSFSEI